MIRVTSKAALRRVWPNALAGVACVAGLAVVVIIMWPVFFQYRVWVGAPAAEVVAALRFQPVDGVLQLVAAQAPIGPPLPAPAEAPGRAAPWVTLAADGHLLARPARAVTRADLVRGEPLESLAFSSLQPVDVLLVAFQATGQEAYLVAARDQLLAYSRYERTAWRRDGFLWNDHAIAARVGVVIRFWAVYRHHELFDSGIAAELLQHVGRCVALLRAPANFTAWSNHGVMQNLALLQAAAAFPGYLEAADLQRLAFNRLSLQWRYYLSDEGVVLEHSAGYHQEGLRLLISAVQLMQAASLQVPAGWHDQLLRAQRFLAEMMRPDGTLPAYGDTRIRAADQLSKPLLASDAAQQQVLLFPLSGYGLLTSTEPNGTVASHAVLTWSYFPGQAHKQADEPGLILWGAGRPWITPTGYAPYGTPYRGPVEGWQGSNAPHGLQETPDLLRHNRLRASAVGQGVTLLDVERLGPAGVMVRRQLVDMGGRRWLVMDDTFGPAQWQATETLWTFMPDLRVRQEAAGVFEVSGASGAAMRVTLLSSGDGVFQVQPLRGSLQPFGGWVATEEDGVQPAPTLRVLSAPQTWTATLFELDAAAPAARLNRLGQDDWEISGDGWVLRRTGMQLHVANRGNSRALPLQVGPDVHPAQQQVTQQLRDTLQRYPQYRDLDHYRWRLAFVLLPLWLAQLAVRWLLSRCKRENSGSSVLIWDVLALAVWTAAGLWTLRVYLVM